MGGVLVTACGGSASRPTPIPKPAFLPDLAGAMLILDDFPSGFERVPGTTFREMTGGLASNRFGRMLNSYFAFQSVEPITFVQGTTFLLATERQQADLDVELIHPDRLLSSMIEGLIGWDPANAVLEQRMLRAPQGIGDLAAAVSARVSWQGGDPLHFEAVIFRRTNIQAFILVYYLDGTMPAAKAEDLARVWDQRLINLLVHPELVETLKPKDADSCNGRGLLYALRGNVQSAAFNFTAATEAYAQAVVEYDAAIAQRADYGDAYLNRGIIQSLRSHREAAIEDLRMAHRISDGLEAREEAAQQLRSLSVEP